MDDKAVGYYTKALVEEVSKQPIREQFKGCVSLQNTKRGSWSIDVLTGDRVSQVSDKLALFASGETIRLDSEDEPAVFVLPTRRD